MRRPRAKPPLSTKRARTFLFWRREGRRRRLLRSSERSYLRPARALAKYGRASEADGVEAHTDGSNPSRSATNLVSETTKELDLRRAGFARDFRPLSAVRFRDRRQRRF